MNLRVTPNFHAHASQNKRQNVNFNAMIKCDEEIIKRGRLSIIKARPNIVVIDAFNINIADVNGDNVEDLSHGKFCASVIRSILSNANIIYGRLKGKKGSNAFDCESMISVAKNFHNIAEKIKNGEKIDAVNFSFQIPKPFTELSEMLQRNITRDNVHEHIDALRNWLRKLGRPENKHLVKKYDKDKVGLKDMYKAISAIEEVTSQGVPVYICAGNYGPQNFNLYSLAKGTIPVRALDGDRSNSKELYFSCSNSLTPRGARGIYYSIQVLNKDRTVKGYKISENSKVIIKNKAIKKGIPVANRFVGKKIEEVLATEADYSLLELKLNDQKITKKQIKRLNQVIFSVDRYINIRNKSKYKLQPNQDKFLRKHSDYVDIKGKYMFRKNTKGLIVLDPENKGINMVGFLYGTSYAAPTLLAKDCKKKYRIKST